MARIPSATLLELEHEERSVFRKIVESIKEGSREGAFDAFEYVTKKGSALLHRLIEEVRNEPPSKTLRIS